MPAPAIRKQLFALSFLYTVVPLALYLWRYKVIAPIYLFSDDTFYYLDIARNSLNRPGFTFDGQHITNGFHPLWQWILFGLGTFHLVHYDDLTGTLMRVFALDVLLLGLAAGFFCVACARYFRQPMLALLTVAPGLFWLLSLGVSPVYFSTWYYANGMESAVALLFFSLALLFYADGELSPPRLLLVSICLGLTVLSRLDDVFLVGSIAIWILLKSSPQGRLNKLVSLSPIALLLAAYLAYNRITVGVFLPLSGAAKATLALGMNLKWTLRLFAPIFTGDPPAYLRTVATRGIFLESTIRQIQMIFPAALCAVELIYRSRKRYAFTFFHAAAIGVILKAAYNVCFVQNFDQGPWYYTVSIAISNFFLVLWISRVVTVAWPNALEEARARWKFAGVHLLAVLFVLNIYFNTRNVAGSKIHMASLDHLDQIHAKLQSLQADKLVELDDGFIGYISGASTVGGLGLVLDKEAAQALKHGHFLDVMYRRGYRVMVGEAGYGAAADVVAAQAAQGHFAALFKLSPDEFRAYRLMPAGGDGVVDGLYYFRIVPAAEATASAP